MSEWIQPPSQLGQEDIINEPESKYRENRQSKIFKFGHKVAKLIGYRAEPLSTSQEVYEYFSRISNNNKDQFSDLTNLFESSCESKGFDLAVQELIDSILSGDLPRPKGLANSFAYMTNPEIYYSENQYNNVLNSLDHDLASFHRPSEQTK